MSKANYISSAALLVCSLIPQYAMSAYYPESSNAQGTAYPGGSPLIAAELFNQIEPKCGDSVRHLSISWKNFVFNLGYSPVNQEVLPLQSNKISVSDVNPIANGIFRYIQWYFSGIDPDFNQVMAFSQAANFYDYLETQLGIDPVELPSMTIRFLSDPDGGPSLNPFPVFLDLPIDVPGDCNNIVNWIEDGSVIPHEIGGHLLTGLTGESKGVLGEPIGDYWGLVMMWDPNYNPEPKIGRWIDVQFNKDGYYLRDPNPTQISYPYGLIEDLNNPRVHYINGQILTGALWNLRKKYLNQFGLVNGKKLADFLVYKLTRSANTLFTGGVNDESTITVGEDSTVVLFSKVRDKLVDILETLQSLPNDGSFTDLYKDSDKYLIIDAFIEKGIASFPADNLFISQVSLHNRGGNDSDRLYHPIFTTNYVYGETPISANNILVWNSGFNTTATDADIDAPEAWAIQTGRNDIVISVVDSGVDYMHMEFGFDYRIGANSELLCALPPCTTGNIWTNISEMQGITGEDDDVTFVKQGEVDDYIGWNSYSNSNDPTEDISVFGRADHGTNVTSVIASHADMISSEGTVGVCWSCSIMSMGKGDSIENGSHVSNVIYSVNHEADIINLSWGARDDSGHFIEQEYVPLFNSLKLAEIENSLAVTAAGNVYQTIFDNSDIRPLYPQVSVLKNIINVTALDENDHFPPYSTEITSTSYVYGKYTVDLAAPQAIISAGFVNGDPEQFSYSNLGDTSSAAPIVSGAIALLLSEQKDRIESNPSYREMSLGEIRYLLLTSVDPIPDLKGITVSGGRVNAYSLLRAYKDSDMDGYTDKIESLFGTAVNDASIYPNLIHDHDGDGMSSEDELGYGTIPVLVDADVDLRSKIYPIYLDDNGLLLTTATEGGLPPTAGDTDGDGVSDLNEVSFGSDPANPHSIIHNIVSNGNIEQAQVSNNLLPASWYGVDNINKSWVTDAAHTGNYSIKFTKSDAIEFSSNNYLFEITQQAPVTLTFGGWSKSDNVVLGIDDKYTLFLYVRYEDGTSEVIDDGDLAFEAGIHEWQKAQITRTFEKNIDFVIPGMKMTGSSTGTAWFDDIFIHIE